MLAVLAVLLLLAGCVPTREIPQAEATDAEIESYMSSVDDSLWATAQLADRFRPPIVEHVVINQGEWVSSLAGCMNYLGYAEYDDELAGSLAYVFNLSDPVAERVDWYLCQATYQVDPRDYGLMGGEMLDFLYRYNTSVLVPCLEGHGVHVANVPSREEAGLGGPFQGWNPYYRLYQSFDPKNSARDRHVFESCPAFPEAEQFDAMRPVW